MTANADLITSERDGVLLVPNRAIIADRSANKYHVYLDKGGELSKVEVTIGLRDDKYTEITGGLREGDNVAVDYVEESFPFGPGQGRGM
jgi:multidrug efflux pump subunit AcrA (membrane-fusion protein)